jgi:hypothetical protein
MNADYFIQKYEEYTDKDLVMVEYYLMKGLSKYPDNVELHYEFSKLHLLQYRFRECLEELELIRKLTNDYRDVKQAILLLRMKIAGSPMNPIW